MPHTSILRILLLSKIINSLKPFTIFAVRLHYRSLTSSISDYRMNLILNRLNLN